MKATERYMYMQNLVRNFWGEKKNRRKTNEDRVSGFMVYLCRSTVLNDRNQKRERESER